MFVAKRIKILLALLKTFWAWGKINVSPWINSTQYRFLLNEHVWIMIVGSVLIISTLFTLSWPCCLLCISPAGIALFFHLPFDFLFRICCSLQDTHPKSVRHYWRWNTAIMCLEVLQTHRRHVFTSFWSNLYLTSQLLVCYSCNLVIKDALNI